MVGVVVGLEKGDGVSAPLEWETIHVSQRRDEVSDFHNRKIETEVGIEGSDCVVRRLHLTVRCCSGIG